MRKQRENTWEFDKVSSIPVYMRDDFSPAAISMSVGSHFAFSFLFTFVFV